MRQLQTVLMLLSMISLFSILWLSFKLASSINNHWNHGNKTGYVLALHYSDQMTQAAVNFFSLQCWAASVTSWNSHLISVVEPFVHQGSTFGMSLVVPQEERNNSLHKLEENIIKLGDIFDINKWTLYTEKKGYSPLVSWEYFLKHAPREIIVVHRTCGKINCMDCQSYHESRNFYQSALTFANEHNFSVVRTACFSTATVSAEDFKLRVYGGYSPVDVVVVFNHWGGIWPWTGSRYRIPVSGLNKCGRNPDIFMPHSANIIANSQRYIQKYMPRAYNKGYVGVMLRMEQYALKAKLAQLPKEQQYQTAMACIKSIIDKVEYFKKRHRVESVFLAMDYGRFGSLELKLSNPYGYKLPMKKIDFSVLQRVAQDFYRMLYGNQSTIEQWEGTFDSIADFKSPGYVAMMQKILASNATCLILAGGGTFHKAAEHDYNQLHSFWHRCVARIC